MLAPWFLASALAQSFGHDAFSVVDAPFVQGDLGSRAGAAIRAGADGVAPVLGGSVDAGRSTLGASVGGADPELAIGLRVLPLSRRSAGLGVRAGLVVPVLGEPVRGTVGLVAGARSRRLLVSSEIGLDGRRPTWGAGARYALPAATRLRFDAQLVGRGRSLDALVGLDVLPDRRTELEAGVGVPLLDEAPPYLVSRVVVTFSAPPYPVHRPPSPSPPGPPVLTPLETRATLRNATRRLPPGDCDQLLCTSAAAVPASLATDEDVAWVAQISVAPGPAPPVPRTHVVVVVDQHHWGPVTAPRLVRSLVEVLGPEDRISLVTLDRRPRTRARMASPSELDCLLRALERRGFHPELELTRALARGYRLARRPFDGVSRVVLLTGGQTAHRHGGHTAARAILTDLDQELVVEPAPGVDITGVYGGEAEVVERTETGGLRLDTGALLAQLPYPGLFVTLAPVGGGPEPGGPVLRVGASQVVPGSDDGVAHAARLLDETTAQARMADLVHVEGDVEAALALLERLDVDWKATYREKLLWYLDR